MTALAEEEEAQREHADRRAAKAAADGARLQLAHERWAASEVGLASAELRASLPICKLTEPLEAAMADHQVAVLCGETGSGKSTQVPQLLLETSLAAGKGGNTFILCTQPRRIAATSLARRVASERGETPGARGSLVGYQVRRPSPRAATGGACRLARPCNVLPPCALPRGLPCAPIHPPPHRAPLTFLIRRAGAPRGQAHRGDSAALLHNRHRPPHDARRATPRRCVARGG
eukprot:scaffold16045_cov110-Isochrysis_galbana.AAC.7